MEMKIVPTKLCISCYTLSNRRESKAPPRECLTALLHPEPTYLGPAVPIYGDGNLTND